jgi:sugar phosphate isomerase/epimerase
MNRRQFISLSGAALAASALKPALAEPLVKHIGINLFTIPTMLEKDFRGAIEFLAGLHYSSVEFCAPYTFSTPEEIARWQEIAKHLPFSGTGFFGLTTAQVQAILKEYRMAAPSMQSGLLTLQTRMGPLAEAAHALGTTYVTLPAMPEENRKTLDDYKRTADAFNAIGEDARRHGLKYAYHNHGYGLREVDGEVPLNVVMQRTDPSLVFFEMDTYWTTAGGGDPIGLLKKYPSRYKLIHLKDMKEIKHFSGDGGNPSQWIELFPYMTSVGDGALDMKGIISQAHQSGVEHFLVEQDTAANPEVALKRSADFLLKS